MRKLLQAVIIGGQALMLAQVSSAQETWQLSFSSGSGSANDISSEAQTQALGFDRNTVYHFVANHFDSINYDGANLYYEFFLSKNNLLAETNRNSSSNRIDISSYHLQVGGTYEWSDWKLIRPYIAATLGTSYYDSRSQSGEPFFSGSFGLGSRYRLTPKLALKVEARAIGTLLDGDLGVFCDEDECALGVDGDVWWQQHITAGVSWSF